MSRRAKILTIYVPNDGAVPVALATSEQQRANGTWELLDPVPLQDAGSEWSGFAATWGAAQQSQIAALTAERGTARAALEPLRAERDTLAARVAELESQLSPTDPQGFPVLTRFQIRFGLLQLGKTDADVESFIANVLPEGEARDEALLRWREATTYYRHNPPQLVDTLGTVLLGVTTAELDSLWRQWGTIQ
jgi:hypothetical protein